MDSRSLASLGMTALKLCGTVAIFAAAPQARAQRDVVPSRVATILARPEFARFEASMFHRFRSRTDSLDYLRNRDVASHSGGYRIVISLEEHRLWVLAGPDTLLSASAAIARGTRLDYEGKSWEFVMPRGIRTVQSKEADPVWQPPEWEYAEAASQYHLNIGHLDAEHPVQLSDGRILSIENGRVGVVDHDKWAPLPLDEHIVFGDTLFVPPLGTENRLVHGELGRYALKLGNGYMIHGTPDTSSIGLTATHGCVRLSDDDIAWLYRNVGVGVKVYVY